MMARPKAGAVAYGSKSHNAAVGAAGSTPLLEAAMYVVVVTSECAPVAKVGGLADVVYGLSRELEIRGNAVEIILPKYDCLWYDQIWGLTVAYENLWVPWFNGAIRCTVWFGFVHGRKCFFIDPHSDDNYFNRGVFYGHYDDPMRFAFFSRAALEFMYKTDKRPDVIHCHDWQTGLVPVLLYEIYQSLGMDRQRVCYTIHNFRHQGTCGEDVLWATGLGNPPRYFVQERLQDTFNLLAINMMKGGIVYSNAVTTVSPRHAWEASNTDLDCGLGGTLATHRDKFSGVLNGLDYDQWNPEADHWIAAPYSVAAPAGKAANKRALRERLLLRDSDGPIVAYVGRLDSQKGVHLVRHSLFYSLENEAQFVLLGSSPEPDTQAHFLHLRDSLNDNPDCHLEIRFSEQLAHLIYAAADILVVPSMYEPCGLTQMIALRYGTVPVVRSVGGLVDTVFDVDNSDRPKAERNGFVFDDVDFPALESALGRAIRLWHDKPQAFAELSLTGMAQDYSWAIPGEGYLKIYEHIRAK